MKLSLTEAKQLPGVERVGRYVLHGKRSKRITLGEIHDSMIELTRLGQQRVTELRQIVATKQVRQIERGKRPSLSSMTKDEMEAYSKQHYGVDLDKRKSLDTLRAQLQELMDGHGPVAAD